MLRTLMFVPGHCVLVSLTTLTLERHPPKDPWRGSLGHIAAIIDTLWQLYILLRVWVGYAVGMWKWEQWTCLKCRSPRKSSVRHLARNGWSCLYWLTFGEKSAPLLVGVNQSAGSSYFSSSDSSSPSSLNLSALFSRWCQCVQFCFYLVWTALLWLQLTTWTCETSVKF